MVPFYPGIYVRLVPSARQLIIREDYHGFQ